MNPIVDGVKLDETLVLSCVVVRSLSSCRRNHRHWDEVPRALFPLCFDFNNFHFCARRMFVDEFIINSIILSLLSEYWILLHLWFWRILKGKEEKIMNSFDCCVCAVLWNRAI